MSARPQQGLVFPGICLGIALLLPSPAAAAPSAASVPAIAAPPDPAPADPAHPIEPGVHPTWSWALAQLIPSPQWTFVDDSHARFGLRWQVTPVLYSLGIRRGLRPWRFLVVEPNVRHSGAFEIFLSPEYTFSSGPFERGLLGRLGARLYLPLVQRGDYLSCSGGASAFIHTDGPGGAIEIGLYTFAGALGLQLTHTPAPATRSTTLTLSVRYF